MRAFGGFRSQAPPSSPTRVYRNVLTDDEAGGEGEGELSPEDATHLQEEREPPEHWSARPLKSRRIEFEKLGEPPGRATCFGCVYFGDNNDQQPDISLARIQVLQDMARQSFGSVDLITLAEAMESYYEREIRAFVNRHLRRGQSPLPRWPAAQILDHLRFHNQDPLIQQVVLLAETQELRSDLLERCFETSSKTGETRANKDNIDRYEKIVKLQLHIQKQDASKMAFYSGNARINPDAIRVGGVVSTHTKKLHDHLKIRK